MTDKGHNLRRGPIGSKQTAKKRIKGEDTVDAEDGTQLSRKRIKVGDTVDAKGGIQRSSTEPCPIPAVASLQSPSESSSPAGASTTTASLDPPQLSPVGSAGNGKPRHAIDTTADCYAMTARYRGLAVVVNNDKFDPVDKDLHLSDRHGTVKDGQDLAKLLIDMGFDDVNVLRDLTGEDMKRDLQRVAKDERHNDADCFVCVILTHGDNGGVLYGTDGVKLTVQDVIAPFANLESLRGKPKLFLFQACRGNMLDAGVDAVDAPGDDANHDPTDDVDAPGNDVDDDTIVFPTDPDLLLAFSCVNGYFSWRHTIEGSVFARAVVKVFGDNWQRMDVGTMMTRVAQKMAYEFQSNTPDRRKSHKKKQVPCLVSTLTKDLYFTPKS